jgi:MFS family permease
MLEKRVWRDFVAVTSSVGVVGIGLGSTLPLAALALTGRGFGPDVVGWMVSVTAMGGIVGTIAAPVATARLGRRRVVLCCLAFAGLSVIPLQYVASLWVWAALRFSFGLWVAPVFVVGEAWISLLPSDAVRGRVVAMYTTSFTLCQVLGPELTNWVSRFPNSAFLLCGAVLLLGAPVIALARDDTKLVTPATDEALSKDASSRWLTIIRKAPAIVAGIAFFAVFDNVTLSFLPLFALDHGFSQSRALTAAAVVLAGDATLQYAVGWLADHYGRARLQFISGVAMCLMLPLLPVIINAALLWAVYFYLLGGLAGAAYTLSMVASGERFSGAALLRASGLIALTWNIASSVGPAATGVAMHQFGPSALPAVLWVMAVSFVVAAGFERHVLTSKVQGI